MQHIANFRQHHSCGLIRNQKNGLEVVVAGGAVPDSRKTAEILTLGTMSWRVGPEMEQNRFQ